MNKRIDLDPLEVEILLNNDLKKIRIDCHQEENLPGIFFETSFKHTSENYTDVIAGGGINYEDMINDLTKKLKKYFEYDSPSFRVLHYE